MPRRWPGSCPRGGLLSAGAALPRARRAGRGMVALPGRPAPCLHGTMRILLTNTALAHRTGSELYVVELALALRARGHDPVVYSAVLGELAGELAAGGVAVTGTLDALAEPPDLIHGHHPTRTLAAPLHLPGGPRVFVWP